MRFTGELKELTMNVEIKKDDTGWFVQLNDDFLCADGKWRPQGEIPDAWHWKTKSGAIEAYEAKTGTPYRQRGEVVRLTLTAPALTRLIGDDAELEVALRHAAVNEIMKYADKWKMDAARTAVDKAFTEIVAERGRSYSLSPRAEDIIRKQLAPAVEAEVARSVSSKSSEIAVLVNVEVEKRVNELVAHEVTIRVARALESLKG